MRERLLPRPLISANAGAGTFAAAYLRPSAAVVCEEKFRVRNRVRGFLLQVETTRL